MRGLSTEESLDIARHWGLSSEEVHRRFIRYRDISEANFFAQTMPPIPAAPGERHAHVALQAVQRAVTR